MKKRSKQSPSRTTKPQLPKQILNLAEEVGHFIKYWGFKSIHGKIWTLTFLSKNPVEAQFYIYNLKVSKALVSLALKDLIKHKVVFEISLPESKRPRYICNPQIEEVILDILRSRELKMLGEIKLAQELSAALNPHRLEEEGLSAERLKDVGVMIEQAQGMLKSMLQMRDYNFSSLAQFLNFEDNTISENSSIVKG